MAARYNRCIGGRLRRVTWIFIFCCWTGLLPTIMTSCEAAPAPDVLDDIIDVAKGDRSLNVNLDKNGLSVSVGPTKEQIMVYCVIGFGVLLLLIGCCVCCCRGGSSRQVHLHTAVIHANPNPNVGYHK